MRIWKPVLFCLFFFCAFCVCFAPAGQESVLSAAALRSSPSSREEIIHNNWSVSGDTPGLSELACRWVNVKYRGANPDRFRAVSVDSRAFPDLLRGFTVTLSDWTVCFQAQPDVLAEEKNAYREQVRMVTVQDQWQVLLAGCPDESVDLATRDDLAAYLSGDVRFSRLILPGRENGPEVQTADLPLSVVSGTTQMALLDEATALVLQNGLLRFYDLRTGALSLSLVPPNFKAPYFTLWNGTIVMQDLLTGGVSYSIWQVAFDGTVVQNRMTDAAAPVFELAYNTLILNDGPSLFLLDPATRQRRLLLEGTFSPLDLGSQAIYRYFQPIDDHRFVYERVGYESFLECGIYDLSDFSCHPIDFDGPRTPLVLTGGRLFTLSVQNRPGSLAITDVREGSSRQVFPDGLPDLEQVPGQALLSADGALLGILAQTDNTFVRQARLYSTQTGQLLGCQDVIYTDSTSLSLQNVTRNTLSIVAQRDRNVPERLLTVSFS